MAIAARIEERLAERLASPPAVRVQGAADFAALGAKRRPAPGSAVYVLALEERSQVERALGSARAMVDAAFAAVVCHANRRDALGGAAVEDLAGLRERVRGALLGWTPAGAELPLAFRAGRLLDAGEGQVWWQDEYETRYLVQAAA